MNLAKPALALALATTGLVGLSVLPATSSQASATAAAASAAATTYNVDPVHTAVVFSAEYYGMSPFYGQFGEFSGSVSYDGSNPDSFSFEMEIPMASIDTNNEARNNHLMAADWFNAREYPTISFKSTGLSDNGDGTMTMAGDLTLHGVTKAIEATVTNLEARQTDRGNRCGFGAHFTVKRSEFGVTNMLGEDGIGDDLTLMVGVQSVAQ